MHPKGQRKLRGAITAQEVSLMKEALEAVSLKMDGTQCCIDIEHQQAMKLYLDSLVARPIRKILQNLQARHDARKEKSPS